MSKKGISYQEFLDGKQPNHIEELGCPMMADQGACHEIKGFTNRCNSLNAGWLSMIRNCKNQDRKECWRIFKKGDL